jgi:hypothetical protein
MEHTLEDDSDVSPVREGGDIVASECAVRRCGVDCIVGGSIVSVWAAVEAFIPQQHACNQRPS